ncbi:MAG: energy transducer TonB [Polyangiales bacterium]
MVAPRSPALEGRTVVASAPSESSTTLHVLAFVTASVLGHVAFAAVMPDEFELPPIEEPPRELAVFFEVDEPEPEPPQPEVVPEPEEEPLELPEEAPEPPPVVRRVVEEPEPEQTPPPAAPEAPNEEPSGGDPEASDDASSETGDAQGTVQSTEGGLAVDRAAGRGQDGAAQGTLRRGSGSPEPTPTPTIDRRALTQAWMIEVHRAIGRATYTRSLLRAELEGRVVVALLVDAEGRVQGVRVARSSGEPMLDEAALQQLSRHTQVPAPPAELSWRPREIQLPIVFELRDRG